MYKFKPIIPLFVISKLRIQSVSNRSSNECSNSNLNDGLITLTPEKRSSNAPFTPNSSYQQNTKVFVSQNRFSLFLDLENISKNIPEPEKIDQEPDLNESPISH